MINVGNYHTLTKSSEGDIRPVNEGKWRKVRK
jgi:hypothetical protein